MSKARTSILATAAILLTAAVSIAAFCSAKASAQAPAATHHLQQAATVHADLQHDATEQATTEAQDLIPVPVSADPAITWWGFSSLEIRLNSKVLIIDPVFKFFRKADYILCSGAGKGFDSPGTRGRILEISPKFTAMLAPLSIPKAGGQFKTVYMLPNEQYEDASFSIKALPGAATSGTELAYLITDKKSGTVILYNGQASDKSVPQLKQALAGQKVTYFIAVAGALGQQGLEELLTVTKPAVVIPCGYFQEHPSLAYAGYTGTLMLDDSPFPQSKLDAAAFLMKLKAAMATASPSSRLETLFTGLETPLKQN